MEEIETRKGEHGPRAIKRRGEPASTQNLDPMRNEAVLPAITIVDRNAMDAGCVENAEPNGTRCGIHTFPSSMTKLDNKSKVLQRYFLEKGAVPFLDAVDINRIPIIT